MNTVSQFETRTPADRSLLRSSAPDGDRKSLIIALIAGLAIEAAVIAAVLHMPRTQPEPEPPRPVMEAEIVAAKPPPPPPPPPVVKKIVKHLAPRTPPKPAPPRVAPPPVPPAVPHVDSPAVVSAPPAPVAAPPAPVQSQEPPAHGSAAPADIAIECPVQTRPELPAKALAEGIVGRVTAHATIRGGRVVKVDIVESTPAGVFDSSVRRAMLQYQCHTNGDDAVEVEQTFDFTEAN